MLEPFPVIHMGRPGYTMYMLQFVLVKKKAKLLSGLKWPKYVITNIPDSNVLTNTVKHVIDPICGRIKKDEFVKYIFLS